MFFVSLRLLRAVAVLLCLWCVFGSNLALWVLLGTLGVSLGTFLALFLAFWASPGLSWVSLGPLLGLP